MALVNRGTSDAPAVRAAYSMLEMASIAAHSTFLVTELFSGKKLGAMTGGFSYPVAANDIAIFRLDPVQ